MTGMELLLLAVAVVLSADRLVSALTRFGMIPGVVLRWDRERVQRQLREEERDRKIDAVLAQVSPNGGTSLNDQLGQLRAELAAHIEDIEPDRTRFKRLLAELEQSA